jgi:importin subunit alpha-6/7
MLEKNWTPRLIKWLRLRDRPTLQVEALWALTNIAAGATDNTSVLLQNGVIPTLVSLLDSSNEEVHRFAFASETMRGSQLLCV